MRTEFHEPLRLALDQIVTDRAVALGHRDCPVAEDRLECGERASGIPPLRGEGVSAEMRVEADDPREITDALVEVARVLKGTEAAYPALALREHIRRKRYAPHLARLASWNEEPSALDVLCLCPSEFPPADPCPEEKTKSPAVLPGEPPKDALLFRREDIGSTFRKPRQPAPWNWRAVKDLERQSVIDHRAYVPKKHAHRRLSERPTSSADQPDEMVPVGKERPRRDVRKRQGSHERQEYALAALAGVLGECLVSRVPDMVFEPALHSILHGEDGFPLLHGRQAGLDAPTDFEHAHHCAVVILAKRNSSILSAVPNPEEVAPAPLAKAFHESWHARSSPCRQPRSDVAGPESKPSTKPKARQAAVAGHALDGLRVKPKDLGEIASRKELLQRSL